MKLIMILSVILLSCGTIKSGKDGEQGIQGEKGNIGSTGKKGDKGDAGPQGDKGDKGSNGDKGDKGDSFTPEVSLAGFWVMPNGGYIELIKNSDNKYVIYGTQRLYSKNFDGFLALHPNLSTSLLTPKGDKLVGEYNANYNSASLDVDGDTTTITGTRKTVYNISLTDKKLKINLKIYSSTGLAIEVDRTLTSED